MNVVLSLAFIDILVFTNLPTLFGCVVVVGNLGFPSFFAEFIFDSVLIVVTLGTFFLDSSFDSLLCNSSSIKFVLEKLALLVVVLS